MSLGLAPIDAEHLARDARIVRAGVPLGDVDPWDLAEPLARPREQLVAWSDGPRATTFLAVGEAARLRVPPGPGRFSAAIRWCSRIAEQVAAVGPRPPRSGSRPPLVVGGLGFSDVGPGSGSPWEAWGAGHLVLPRLLVHRSAGRTVAFLAERAAPGRDPQAALRRLLANLPPGTSSGAPSGPLAVDVTPTSERGAWLRGVEAALDRLSTGDDPALRKVVLARAARFAAPEGHAMDALATARALRARHRACTTFAFRAADGSAFVGATPEVLVRLEGRRATTAALAGTTSRGADPREDHALAEALRRHAKDQREHGLVVEAIREALAPLAGELEVAPEPRVRALADVQHLETPIAATLERDTSIWDLVARLHPTPAVGGLPRAEALSWLQTHEALDRGWYAAPVGWVDDRGDGAFHVALRSALLRGRDAWAFAGAGIVPGSDPEAEWTETVHKLRAIRQALAVRPEGRR